MKTTYLIALATLSIFAISSCNKDSKTADEEGEKGTIIITLTGGDQASSESATRAAPPSLGTENALKKGVVFVFRGTGANPALDSKTNFDFTSATPAPLPVTITKGIRQIYAVANIDPADFAAVNNLSDLYAVANKLSLTTFRSGGALPMSGFASNVDLTTATTATVQLNFIGSRIHVDWDISNLNPGLTGTLTIQGASILNAKTMSNYFAAPTFSLTKDLNSFAQGYASTLPVSFTGSYLPTGAGVTDSYDAVLNVAPADKGFTTNYTYVLENNSVFPTIVAFYGTYEGTTYYWPVVINGALNTATGDGTTSITRGNIYNVKANIKGLGYTDPYTPINPGSAAITITTAVWNPVLVINQDFN